MINLHQSLEAAGAQYIPIYDVYVIGSFLRAPVNGQAFYELRRGEFFVGSYSGLKTFREEIKGAGGMAQADIHHIVENNHLQFLDFKHKLSETTYEHQEPCVMLHHTEHRLFLTGGFRSGEKLFANLFKMERENRPKNLSEANVVALRDHKVKWIQQNGINAGELEKMFLSFYDTVYDWPEFAPLRRIVKNVLEQVKS